MSRIVLITKLLLTFWFVSGKYYLTLFVVAVLASYVLYIFKNELIVAIVPLLYANWILILVFKLDKKLAINNFYKIYSISKSKLLIVKLWLFYMIVVSQFLFIQYFLNMSKWFEVVLITLIFFELIYFIEKYFTFFKKLIAYTIVLPIVFFLATIITLSGVHYGILLIFVIGIIILFDSGEILIKISKFWKRS